MAANRAPRAVVVADNQARARGWQDLVASSAQQAAGEGPFVGPVAVAVVFRLPRPASLPKRKRHHLTKPDLDKLARCCLDGLTGILYADDRSVVDLRARKLYADARGPGAEVVVSEAVEPDPSQSALDLFAED